MEVSPDLSVDVAVAGGGACGLMTAIRAARNPDRVVAIFEKSVTEGCNAAISSGSLAAGGTSFQQEAGINDSPELHADDIVRGSGDEEWRPVVEALCAAAPKYVEWVASTGYPIEIGVDMPRAGMSAPRLHSDVGRQGGGRLIRHLRALVDDLPNVAFVDAAPVQGLLSDSRSSGGPHSVQGLVVSQNGEQQRIEADTVVLATDGFGADPALIREHLDLGDPFYGGVATSTGDAILWLRELNAPFRNMGAGLRSGLVVVDRGTRVSPALQFNGAVLVNTKGHRFVDEESKGYSGLASVLQAQPGERAAMIWDETAMEATRNSEMMRESLKAGAVRTLSGVQAVAEALSISAKEATQALRPMLGRRTLTAPFYFAWVTHGILATQGGVTIDPSGRVLDGDGRPIDNLYAGGGTACGLAGRSSAGYLSGSGLLSAFGMGWIVGNDLADG